MSDRRVVDDVPATSHFDFLYGRYHLSSWVIPYFSTIMPLRDTAKSLRLVVDFPGSDEIPWRLDELYQREVDWPRVERRILPYLRATEQPQFFNALTIALLPQDPSGYGMTQGFSAATTWHPPGLLDPGRFAKVHTVGPITCGYWTSWNTFSQAEARTGQIRWNPDEIFAVALDGQHRLAAIKELVNNPSSREAHWNETSVPVIFVVLDPGFGYVNQKEKLLVDVLRVIFIDLNKHAKVPTRARQILLDDKDPTSVCVRALVGESLCDGTDELDAELGRLPLSLVDWHTEQAKFDEGPYITTILVLDWAIAALLGAKPVQDFTDYNAIRNQLKALSSSLAIDLKLANRRLADLASVQFRPFSYSEDPDNDELDQIARAFQCIWNPVFVKLLTEFGPYRDLIDLRRQKRTFTLDFSNWYRLRYQYKRDHYAGRATQDYKQFVGRLSARQNPLGESKLDSMLADLDAHKNNNLAFNVVFQRSYFLAFQEWCSVDDLHLYELESFDDDDAFDEDGSYDDESGDPVDGDGFPDAAGSDLAETDPISAKAAHVLVRAQEYVDAMNKVVDNVPEILCAECLFETSDGTRQRFWLGALLTAERGIDFTQGASVRGPGDNVLGGRHADVRRNSRARRTLGVRRLLGCRA